jgi:Ca2+-binding RTX toxin-like protein
MATLTAHQRVDNSGSLDLDLATVPNVTENNLYHDVKYFSGTIGLDLHSSLEDLKFIPNEVYAGTIDTVTETKGGNPAYELSTLFKLEDLYTAQGVSGVFPFVHNLFSGDDFITGSKEGDSLYGFAGDDTIDGGKGADVLVGGDGKDTLTGGRGSDEFIFDALVDPANADHITDFKHGKDQLAFDPMIFHSLVSTSDEIKGKFFHVGKQAGDHNDYLIYNDHNGKLYYDDDGNGAHAQIKIATLDHHPTLSSHDLQFPLF